VGQSVVGEHGQALSVEAHAKIRELIRDILEVGIWEAGATASKLGSATFSHL
jgi:hypothetical protein